MKERKKSKHIKLNQFLATAISGNDILSSCLYVSGIAIIFAGVFAPIVLLGIGLVLFFYKAVYTEVVEALPINGGVYNCLLNATSKLTAGIAGITTMLSYVATAVISSKIAVEYLHTVIKIPVIPMTIALLFVFALLVISGIKDSAKVALGIFGFHILVLISFLVFGLMYSLKGESHFITNIAHTKDIILTQGSIWKTLFFAFSASLLGVSGFESSANFVEEQDKGVFRKTLRNMLIGVAIFNPLIALIVLNSLPFEIIAKAKDFLLADAGLALGGQLFRYLIVSDAFLVLSGAVLTSYVGISGLISRMAADGCLPNFLTKENKKQAYPRIILTFFLLCSSILLLTRGNLLSLAGVYTIAFLGVMTLFAFGNLILRETRPELKRTYHAPVLFVILALFSTLVGIIGNIKIDPRNLIFFACYFIPSVIIVLFVIYQDYLMRFALRLTKRILFINHYLHRKFEDLIEGKFIVFVHEARDIYQILHYINKNETGRKVIMVHCKDPHKGEYREIKEVLPHLQKAGVYPHLNVSLIYKPQTFGPEMIEKVSREFRVRKNRILIGSVRKEHPFDFADFGGVRIIL